MPLSLDAFGAWPRCTLVLLASGVLAGCAGMAAAPLPPVAVPVVPAPQPAPVEPVLPAPTVPPPPQPEAEPDPEQLKDMATRRVLAYQERLRELPPAELAREQARLSEPNGDPGQALELALVFATTRQAGDLARALALVEPLARPGGPAAWRPIARLLQARLAEQRRLEEQGERQAQQLREQQRRLDQLNSQLEALRNIERSIVTRPAPAAPAGPGGGRTP